MERMDANRKIDKEEMMAKLDADRKTDKEERKAAQERADADRAQMQEMTKMMQANQTNTDTKLESLSDRIEKTQMALQTAEIVETRNCVTINYSSELKVVK
jgi:transcriptional regulator of heat shock response